jgi:predicted nucleotidyltransferase component of viral defense system
MDSVVLQMLGKYKCKTSVDYENALKEIMQEIALLGLWRAKFFEHALFYGGTALRILHKLPRFSEDLDFSLLKKDEKFDLKEYHEAIKVELEAFGFLVEVEKKERSQDSQIESAFIKASTKTHFIKISTPKEISGRIQSNQILKIKIELDTNPPGKHGLEVIDVFRPVVFQVKTMPLEDLFAGKLHAVLARSWKRRAKGRDFYDYLWYIGQNVSPNLEHLQERLIQSGHLNTEEKLTTEKFKEKLFERFQCLDIDQARQDVRIFLNERERQSLEVWGNEFFIKSISRINLSGY